jgi:hypothetical protein
MSDLVFNAVPSTSAVANYKLAVAHGEMNPRRRSTMEDCHRVVPVLSDLSTVSYFGVYDGNFF